MRYDTVIVGGGSAGAILAGRLSEDSTRSVLLLEAGPDFGEPDLIPEEIKTGGFRNGYASYDWAYEARATPQQAHPMPLPRGKVTGGSGSINGQVFQWGLPEDYDGWAKAGNDRWSWAEVFPCFRRIESDLDLAGDSHGASGPIFVRRAPRSEWLPHARAFHTACLEEGFRNDPDQNHPESTGVGAKTINNRDGVRWSAALAYLSPARHRLNLTVRGEVLVRRVLFDESRAVGVEAESGGETFVVEAGEVVLSAGVVASPQILLLSGVGPGAQLREFGIPVVHDLPGVGENLRDHPGVFLLYDAIGDAADIVPAIQVGLRYTVPGSSTRNDVQITTLRLPPSGQRRLRMNVGLQNPETAGRLRLRSADPRQQPEIDFRYLTSSRDRERLRHGARLADRLALSRAFDGIVTERFAPDAGAFESDASLDAWMLENVTTFHHAAGTCKMGPSSDPLAVVDQCCRVHGIDGLRVVDAAAMPDVVRANSNATTMMIAERVAGWMLDGTPASGAEPRRAASSRQ